MRLYKLLLIVVFMFISCTLEAKDDTYLFNVKVFDITKQGDVDSDKLLEPFSNPKMLVKEGVPAKMLISGEKDKTLQIALDLTAHDKNSFDINYILQKNKEIVSGPINTKKFSADKSWRLVANFDGKRLLLVVNMDSDGKED